MKKAAETADPPHDLFTGGAAYERFDSLHKEVGLIDIHAGLPIGCRHHYHPLVIWTAWKTKLNVHKAKLNACKAELDLHKVKLNVHIMEKLPTGLVCDFIAQYVGKVN